MLDIQPVGELEDQRAVFAEESLREVIFSVDNEKVGRRFVAPLKPGVKVHVIKQLVVLHVGGKKNLVGEGDIKSWTYQEESFVAIVSGQSQVVEIKAERNISIGLIPVIQLPVDIKVGSIVKPAVGGLRGNI